MTSRQTLPTGGGANRLNALADGIASQVALARRFNIRAMLRIGKAKTSMKTMLVAVLRLKNPKPPMTLKAGNWRRGRAGPQI